MMSRAEGKADLLAAVLPILDYLRSAAPTGEPVTPEVLAEQFPLDGPLLTAVRAKVVAGLDAGWLTPREANGVRFGRVAKPSPESRDFSIDAVDMDGPGPGHSHPMGEVDLCFALTEGAQFDGNPEGWVVYGPSSWHIPTVTDGRMAVLYFLPTGAIRFESQPS